MPHCCCVAQVDGGTSREPAYVFKAVYSPQISAVAASTSCNVVQLYAMVGAGLQSVNTLSGHSATISDVAFCIQDSPHLVHTSSADGTVRGWDIRSNQQVEK